MEKLTIHTIAVCFCLVSIGKTPTRKKRTIRPKGAIPLYLGRGKNYKLTVMSFSESFLIASLCLSSQITQWAAVITCLRPMTMKKPSSPHLHPPIRVPEHILVVVGSTPMTKANQGCHFATRPPKISCPFLGLTGPQVQISCLSGCLVVGEGVAPSAWMARRGSKIGNALTRNIILTLRRLPGSVAKV